MIIGTIIGIISIGLIGLAFAICWAIRHENDDEYSQVVERRLRDVRRMPPDYPGDVRPFERRK